MRVLLTTIKRLLPQKIINYFYHLPKAFLAARAYGNPSKDLIIIGVTGTDGKTTTTHLIYHILRKAKKKVALISTIQVKIGRKNISTGLHVTSPDPFKLQSFLRRMRSKKIKYVCLESTSHGLDQFRLFGIHPKIAVLTNITHEHLDYHKSMESYTKAKLRLLKKAESAVVNKDLEIFHRINASLPKVMFSTFSIDSDSQLKPLDVQYLKTKTKFTIGNMNYEVPLTGKYNLYNTLAAISTTLILDISPADIQKALSTFPPIPGRFEKIPNDQLINIIIDFAHTPNAMENALKNINDQKLDENKVIAVFGAAGLRDRAKRPVMGEIAARLADEVVLTAEDPRTEKVEDIIQDIQSGIPKNQLHKVHIIPNRQEAISYALNELAAPKDWVGIFGKGHEKSMCYGRKEIPWSDQKAVKIALGTSK